MKFGAVLRDSAVDLPDTEDLFLKYKQLKKSIKRMQSTQQTAANGPHHDISDSDSDDNAAKEAGPSKPKRAKHNKDDPELEAEFLRVITADVMELNDRYIEKEEDNVIKFSQLEDAAEAASTPQSRATLYRAFVDLHGELLMLFHWSVLAYTGLCKILKKHRKRTGAPLHAPHLENLLSQPFCSVEVTCDMVRKAEEWVSKLAKDLNVAPPPAVPLPEGLLTAVKATSTASGEGKAPSTAGADAGGNATTTANLKAGPSPAEEKAKVLEAVAAAVAIAEAAEKEAAAVASKEESLPKDDENRETTCLEANDEAKKKKNTTAAAVVATTASEQENLALRRIRAALNVWQQLHTNVSTPSTMIAPGAGAITVVAAPPASLTTSSIA
jgi:hypothetical protein